MLVIASPMFLILSYNNIFNASYNITIVPNKRSSILIFSDSCSIYALNGIHNIIDPNNNNCITLLTSMTIILY